MAAAEQVLAQRKLQLVVLSLKIRSLREKVVDASSRAMPANRQLKHLRPSLGAGINGALRGFV